jgi:hypothetical protein
LRRTLSFLLFIALLVALDLAFNQGRIIDELIGALQEFIRVSTRVLTRGS